MVESDQAQAVKRRGPDLWIRLLPWLCWVGWLLMVGALYMAASAQPETETLVERWHGKEVNRAWNLLRLHWMFRLSVGSLVTALVGLAINSQRLRRKRDELRVNLVLLTLVALALIGFYLWRVAH